MNTPPSSSGGSPVTASAGLAGADPAGLLELERPRADAAMANLAQATPASFQIFQLTQPMPNAGQPIFLGAVPAGAAASLGLFDASATPRQAPAMGQIYPSPPWNLPLLTDFAGYYSGAAQEASGAAIPVADPPVLGYQLTPPAQQRLYMQQVQQQQQQQQQPNGSLFAPIAANSASSDRGLQQLASNLNFDLLSLYPGSETSLGPGNSNDVTGNGPPLGFPDLGNGSSLLPLVKPVDQRFKEGAQISAFLGRETPSQNGYMDETDSQDARQLQRLEEQMLRVEESEADMSTKALENGAEALGSEIGGGTGDGDDVVGDEPVPGGERENEDDQDLDLDAAEETPESMADSDYVPPPGSKRLAHASSGRRKSSTTAAAQPSTKTSGATRSTRNSRRASIPSISMSAVGSSGGSAESSPVSLPFKVPVDASPVGGLLVRVENGRRKRVFANSDEEDRANKKRQRNSGFADGAAWRGIQY